MKRQAPIGCIINSDLDNNLKHISHGNSDICRLIESQSLLPVFQPIYSVHRRKVVGYEFLARSNILGCQTAGQMFSVAERCHSSVVIELSKACRDSAVTYANQLNLYLPIYLNTHPAEDIIRDVLPQMAALRQRFESGSWVLELHENLLVSAKDLTELAPRFSRLNIDLALDDVGSGRDRLQLICEAKIRIVKLCRELFRSSRNAAAIASLVRFIQSCGSLVVAEGIETREEFYRCKIMGVNLAQGYYLGRPRRVDQQQQRLSSGNTCCNGTME